MGEKTINKIEEKIQNNASIDHGKKAELLELMGHLKLELEQLRKTDSSKARAIADLTETSTQKAFDAMTAVDVSSETPLKELETSVEEFEVSHPRLVRVINRICIMLSSIGI